MRQFDVPHLRFEWKMNERHTPRMKIRFCLLLVPAIFVLGFVDSVVFSSSCDQSETKSCPCSVQFSFRIVRQFNGMCMRLIERSVENLEKKKKTRNKQQAKICDDHNNRHQQAKHTLIRIHFSTWVEFQKRKKKTKRAQIFLRRCRRNSSTVRKFFSLLTKYS